MNENDKILDDYFPLLAQQVRKLIEENEGKIGTQEEQIKLLMSLEHKCQFYACKSRQMNTIYKKFVDYITKDVKNVLSAKIYFREKHDVLNGKIMKIIKNEEYHELANYRGNYRFLTFMMKHWEGKIPDKVQRYYDEAVETRSILIENNIPLAINRAKIFYNKTPKSHLTLLDLIDLCIEGLVYGIDKYYGHHKTGFITVSTGSSVARMIQEYSQTFIRLVPNDKKILYRTNSLRFRSGVDNIKELTQIVNESFEQDKKNGMTVPKLPISEHKIVSLLNSTSYSPMEISINDDDGTFSYTLPTNTIDNSVNVEKELVNDDAMKKLEQPLKELDLVEQKAIAMKYGESIYDSFK